MRIIDHAPRSHDDFVTRMGLFVSETFRALLAQEPMFRILSREGGEFVDLARFHQQLARFLNAAQSAGYVRSTLSIDLVTGAVLDRLATQIMYAAQTKDKTTPTVLTDKDYLEEWLAANTELLLYGFAGRTG